MAVDDAAKTYAERFYDEEEYNIITNNKPTTPRTDRAWRWGADLYKYDTEAYISAYYGKGNDKYGADLVCVTDAGKALFIKMWRDAIYRPMFIWLVGTENATTSATAMEAKTIRNSGWIMAAIIQNGTKHRAFFLTVSQVSVTPKRVRYMTCELTDLIQEKSITEVEFALICCVAMIMQ